MDSYAMDESDDLAIHSDEENAGLSPFVIAPSIPIRAPSTNPTAPNPPTAMESMMQTVWEGVQRIQMERDEEKKEKARKARRKAEERQ